MKYINMGDDEFKKERIHAIAVNVRRLLDKNGVKQTKLAEYCGVQRSTMSDYLNERSAPSFGVIQKIADFFEVPKSAIDPVYVELLTEKGMAQKNNESHTIKVYGKIAAGQPLEAIEDITEEIVYPWLKDDIDIENIFALQVNGDSMDKVVPDNYYAIFEKQNTVRTGEIAAVIVNGGDATLKKVHLLSNKIILEPLSHNLEHEEQAYKEFDDVRIIGRYIGCVSPYSEN